MASPHCGKENALTQVPTGESYPGGAAEGPARPSGEPEVARDLRDLAAAVQSTDSELKATRVRAERLPLPPRVLLERMRAVRGAARYVFRDHPEVVKRATSDYERKRKRKRSKNLACKRSAE